MSCAIRTFRRESRSGTRRENSWLIDWENVMLAPKEADLFSFCEEEYAHLFCENAG